MPWYELNRRAPPTPGNADGDDGGGGRGYQRHPEEQVDVQNYLDDGWNYAPARHYTSSGNDGEESNALFDQHNNFDGFQHQVESQLASVFPTASSYFSSSNSQMNFASQQSTFPHTLGTSNYSPTHHSQGHDHKEAGGQQHHAQNQNQNPNLISNVGLVSKTEQFFHPRPVRTMMPYKNFFSPLVSEGSDVSERKPTLNVDNNIEGIGNAARHSQQQQNSFHSQDQQIYNHQHDSFHSQAGQGNVQEQQYQQGSLHSQDKHGGNFQQGQPATPAQHGARGQAQVLESSQESSNNGPTSNLKPTDLFDASIPSKTPLKRPTKQAKLVQDSTTGQVVAKSNSCSDKSNRADKRKAKSWDSYAGRPVDDGSNKDNQSKEKTKEKKKPKKRKSKDKDKKQSKSGNDIGSLLLNPGKSKPINDSQEGDGAKKKRSMDKKQAEDDSGIDSLLLNHGKKRQSNDSREGDGAKAAAKRSKSEAKKQRKQKRDRSLPNSGTELEIPSYDIESASKPECDDASPTLSVKDFAGIEGMGLCNAAENMACLEEFLTILGRQKHVSFTMLFLDPVTGHYTLSASDDSGGGKKKKRSARSNKYTQNNPSHGFECTTPFLPTSKTYCTPKGPQCTAWNCTCDDQIRAMRGSATLLGAMFIFNDIDSDGEEDGGAGNWKRYLLPLGPTDSNSSTKQEVEYPRMTSWPVNPFVCDAGLSERWSAFEAILLNEGTKLVTYNAVVNLLPYYHHISNDGITGISDQASRYAACLAGASDDNFLCRNDGYLRSVWDLRLVSWMLRPHATDAELEFSTFREGFAHLAPDHQQALTLDMPILMQGLAEAKNNLEFIHSLYPIMNNQMVNGGLLEALEYIEAPVQSILARMESRGIGFQSQRLKKIEKDLETRIEELETQSRSIAKDPDFLLSSPQQVSAFLFDVLKLTIPSGLITKTKAGSSHRSTSEAALKAIQAEMKSRTGSSPEIIDIVLEFRGLNKLLTTYIRPLPKVCKRVITTNGRSRSKQDLPRIYPQWMQTAVRTGRLSCRKPNLQQIPNEGAFGVNPRDAFVAKKGMCLFAADYSQKEVRILAHMSGDGALLSLFRGDPNVDIYKQMSSLIRNKPIESITKTERAQFKQVTLAILYGMSPNQVAKNLSISKGSAQQMMSDFFRRFRGVKTWMDETKEYARKHSFVKTIAGRKRYLDDINSDDNGKKSQAERQAINTVIQGSAADLMKSAMINMAQNLMRWQDDSDPNDTSTCPLMLLQIHDELILEVRFSERDIKRLKDIAQKSCCLDCENFFGLQVPLLLKVSCGRTWGAMAEV